MTQEDFFIFKGLVALLATVLLIIHMSISWDKINRWGQRLRYLTLFYFAVVITSDSVDAIRNPDATPFDTWAKANLVGAILLAVTMVVSIREDRLDLEP